MWVIPAHYLSALSEHFGQLFRLFPAWIVRGYTAGTKFQYGPPQRWQLTLLFIRVRVTNGFLIEE